MKKIPLTQGYFALVDDEDFVWLSKHKWHCIDGVGKHTIYVGTNINIGRKQYKYARMHRLILGLKTGDKTQVDHIDGDGLNNQRNNLRLCNNQQNTRNSRIRSGTSKYKGVSWNTRAQKWQAGLGLTLNNKRRHVALGCYNNEKEAAKAYDLAAIYYFGDFARINFDKFDYKDLIFDFYKHVGRFQPDNRGSKHGASKLTELNVIKIRQLIKQGVLHMQIAKQFNVSQGLISLIRTRRAWKHV